MTNIRLPEKQKKYNETSKTLNKNNDGHKSISILKLKHSKI